MKLPKNYNLYRHNEILDEMETDIAILRVRYNSYSVDVVVESNLVKLNKLAAKILHLQLALEEIGKLREKR